MATVDRGVWRRFALLAFALPLAAGAAPPGPDFDTRLLAAHNQERAALGLPPMRWDARLAQSAQLWADHLAQSGGFAHAPEDDRDPQGENLWAGTRARFTAEQMVDGWAREKRAFKPGVFPDNSTTGRWEDVGHYTQMVWRRTGAVGCAVAAGADQDVLVCRYTQPGNYEGERPY